MSVSTTASDRARRCRRESSPEPPNILSPIRRPRRERRALARFDDEDEVVQQLCGPPRLIKCTVCGQFLPRQHFTADGILHDACIECRATIPSSRLPFTDNIDALAIPQHAIDYIRNFHNECDKITVDTCIICNERWFGLDVSREGRYQTSKQYSVLKGLGVAGKIWQLERGETTSSFLGAMDLDILSLHIVRIRWKESRGKYKGEVKIGLVLPGTTSTSKEKFLFSMAKNSNTTVNKERPLEGPEIREARYRYVQWSGMTLSGL
ncbi:hypothetical protein I352_02004 [Cryptococcus deuterogattii MMRL2647]|nr:hypothetical protein I352_02004 [Cryptococcus deuterogattii MMRL2647]